MRKLLASGLVAALIGVGCALPTSFATAAPVIEFDFLGSGQTFGPTDTVEIRGRLTNVGDETLPAGISGTGSWKHQAYVYDQYWFATIDDWPEFWHPDQPALAPGESVEWTILTYTPWPYKLPDGSSGKLGDPVLPGVYEIKPNEVVFRVSWLVGNDLQSLTAVVGPEDSFRWTVVAEPTEPGQVPSPGVMLLLTAGLCGLWLMRR